MPAHAHRAPRRIPTRLPWALASAFVAVFATPSLAGPMPTQDVAGIVSVASAAPAFEPAPGAAADFGRVADPRGERSASEIRVPPPLDSLTGYAWPIHGARITLGFGPSRFGSRIVDGAAFHDGIDLATFCGDRITAAHDGTVLAAGRHYDEVMGWVGDLTAYTARLDAEHLWLTLPNVVVVDDGNGYRSVYAHFRKVVVAPGDIVHAGDLLGYEGATGRATGCHLHYGLFSPDEVRTFQLEPKAAAHMLLPAAQIARVDPLLVLPPLEDAGIRE